MPRFYFDLHDGSHCVYDTDGIVLRDAEDARAQALLVLSEIACKGMDHGIEPHDNRRVVLRVSDEDDETVLTAELPQNRRRVH
jgi:hypothetical protein